MEVLLEIERLRDELLRAQRERDDLRAQLRDALADRARLSDELLHTQRIEATGTLAAGLAHDMNNVLASIMSFADLLIDDCTDTRTRADLEQIVAQAERGASLTRGLLAFSRKGQYRRQVVEIDRVVRDVLPLLAHTLPKSIEVSLSLGASGHRVDADPVQLAQVLVNLGINAADAMSGNGRLALASDVVELDAVAAEPLALAPGRYTRIRVHDSGCGMDDAIRRRIFEPFFTTKPPGKGTGLGLSLVWGVIRAHDGAVDVATVLGRGTTFSIHLPITEAPLATRPRKPSRRMGVQQATILVVDDEPRVREGTTRILQRVGYAVLGAGDGADGLRVYAENRDAIGLVIVDMAMPVMNGAECFRQLRALSDIPVLIATGYAIDQEVQAMIARDAQVIEKPFSSSDLIVAVARLLDRRGGRAVCV